MSPIPRVPRLAAIAIALALGVPAATSAAVVPSRIHLGLAEVADGLSSPLGVTSARDGSGRLFVIEQTGAVRIVEDGSLRAAAFIDISRSVSHGGEQGLLGLAFHPSYKTNGKLYLSYTDVQGTSVIREYRVSAATRTASTAPAAGRSCASSSPTRTTTAATSRSDRTGTCTSASATGAAAVTRATGRRTGTRCSASCCASTSTGGRARSPTASRQRTRTSAGPASTRSGHPACATRGASRSIGRPATSGSATWASPPGKRSIGRRRSAAGMPGGR